MDTSGSVSRTRAGMPAVLGALGLLAALWALPGGSATGAPTWAPASSASIHPGVQTVTPLPDGGAGQCTANFVFSDGVEVYLGIAAHCAGLGGATDTNGCETESLPLDSEVEIDGATRPGRLAYSSWLTMQAVGESDENVCFGNDLALVRIDPADHGRVNPSVPFWGGPTSLGASTAGFDKVYSYGNSTLRLGLRTLSPKEGYSLGTRADGWSHSVYTLSPGVPGDSGSAVLGMEGEAIGVLSTVVVFPLPASNDVSDLAHALAYMRAHTDLDGVALVPGTEPFVPGFLP